MTVQKETLINDTYKNLKSDLTLCVKYHRRNKPELVKEYFWTDEREKINEQLSVICKPFSLIQKIQISRLVSDLHNFYPSNITEWQTKNSSKNSKPKSKSLNGETMWEA